jgi:ribosomal protein S18 acetylase RimI-like enzyme
MHPSPGLSGRPVIRRYRASDREAVYDICVRTGDRGRDARGRFRSDDLLPDIFAGPYLRLEPQLAFVLAVGARPVGYVLGTADTAAFVRAYSEQWIPALAGRHPEPADPPLTPEDRMLAMLRRPGEMLWPELAAHPAHLHIDILEEYRGAGHGRRLIERFAEAAAGAGAAGMHVGVSSANLPALRFYERVGFARLEVPDPGPVVYLGRRLDRP